jgi:hypothetical protein
MALISRRHVRVRSVETVRAGIPARAMGSHGLGGQSNLRVNLPDRRMGVKFVEFYADLPRGSVLRQPASCQRLAASSAPARRITPLQSPDAVCRNTRFPGYQGMDSPRIP